MQYLETSAFQYYFIQVCVLLTFNSDICRGNETANTRALDGSISHPYTILLRVGTDYFCSGAILDVRWIVSAAQCHHSPKEPAYAFAGMKSYKHISKKKSRSMGLQVRKIAILHVHPRYCKESLKNDIMLGKTEVAWNFGDEVSAIHIVELKRYDLKDLSKLKAVGFKKEENSANTINMFEVIVTISNVTECSGKWNRLQKRSVVCTKKPGISICPYNAGGPLVSSDMTLSGIITTFWRKCRDTQEDMMFTYLPYYARWMKSVMMPHKNCFNMFPSHSVSFILVLGTLLFLIFHFQNSLMCQSE